MTVVGNDVVDFRDISPAPERIRRRFVERVCASSERALLDAAHDARAVLWALFAAKEAAFKALSKLGPVPVFAHRRFVVCPDGDWRAPAPHLSGAVEVESRRFTLSVAVTGDFVHALAWLGPAAPDGEVVEDAQAPGAAARRGLLARLGVAGAAVLREPREGTRDGLGPPFVAVDGRRLPVDVSLSHDGRFGAWAMLC